MEIKKKEKSKMSNPLFKTDILFIQRLLSSSGLYAGKLDGKYSALLQLAEDRFDELFTTSAKKYGAFDTRTEGIIQTLMPKAQDAARQFMLIAAKAPFQVKLLSGTRTYAEQNILFAKRPIVTKARGGQSNHNFGIAWDVGIFVDGKYYEGKNNKETKAYVDLSKLIMPTLGKIIEWGGNWKSITDIPHYGLLTNKSISQVRSLFEAGKSYV